MMSRPSVLASAFDPYAHYAGAVHSAPAGLTYRQPHHARPRPHPQPHPPPMPMPMRAPEPAYHAHLQLPHAHHHAHPLAAGPLAPSNTFAMSGSAYAMQPDDDDLARFQKLSNDYEPEPAGPLVGDRQSSDAIAVEYANADPIYQVKTQALPSKYAYFRTCRGDGHCGWRAIAFTYFEALLRAGDVNKFEEEQARLLSMNNVLQLAGFQEHVYVDWVEDVVDLLKTLASHLHEGTDKGADHLLQIFNDFSSSMSIITYFKILTSACVQSRSDDFQAFVPMDVKTYCHLHIEAQAAEIDNVAIVALSDALIKPAGIGLEIMYLDRSEGDEANVNSFAQPTDHNGMPLPSPPTIRLLYRPGHYDILYKAEDFPPPVQQAPIVPPQAPLHVALANYTDAFMPVASNVDVMAMIPGMYSTGLGQRWPSVSYDFDASPVSQSQITPVQSYAPTPAPPTPITTSHQDFMSVHASHMAHHNPPSHHSIQLEQPPITLPIHPAPPPPVNMERAQRTIERGGPFRPSVYEFEPGFGTGQVHALPFQTSIFRNSHYNTAHFLNPDFQPEEWSPDSEYATGNKGRHKSTSQ